LNSLKNAVFLAELRNALYCLDLLACVEIAAVVRGDLRDEVLRVVLRVEDFRVVLRVVFLRGFARLADFATFARAESDFLCAEDAGFLRLLAAFLAAFIAERCADAMLLPERFAFLKAVLKARENFVLDPLLRSL
jgi:hypothetical protein